MLRENPRYARHKIFSNRRIESKLAEEESSEGKEILGKEMEVYIINGKPDFSDIHFEKYGWKRINKFSLEEKKTLENTPGYKDYKETIIYEGSQGKAIVHANYKKDRHKLAIYVNNLDDPLNMTIIRSMFQAEWGLPLEKLVMNAKSN